MVGARSNASEVIRMTQAEQAEPAFELNAFYERVLSVKAESRERYEAQFSSVTQLAAEAYERIKLKAHGGQTATTDSAPVC
jgi:hypothetical protein